MPIVNSSSDSGDGGGLTTVQSAVLDHVTYNSTSNTLVFDIVAEFPPGSILIGQSRISSALEVLTFRTYNGDTSLGITERYDSTGSLGLPRRYKLAAQVDVNVNLLSDIVLPNSVSVNYTTTGDNMTVGFKIIPAEIGEVRAKFVLASDPTRVIFNETHVYTQDEVDAGTPHAFTVSNPYILAAGVDVIATFEGASLRGSAITSGPFIGQSVPYFVSQTLHYDVESLMTVEHKLPLATTDTIVAESGKIYAVDTTASPVTIDARGMTEGYFEVYDAKGTFSFPNPCIIALGTGHNTLLEQKNDAYRFVRSAGGDTRTDLETQVTVDNSVSFTTVKKERMPYENNSVLIAGSYNFGDQDNKMVTTVGGTVTFLNDAEAFHSSFIIQNSGETLGTAFWDFSAFGTVRFMDGNDMDIVNAVIPSKIFKPVRTNFYWVKVVSATTVYIVPWSDTGMEFFTDGETVVAGGDKPHIVWKESQPIISELLFGVPMSDQNPGSHLVYHDISRLDGSRLDLGTMVITASTGAELALIPNGSHASLIGSEGSRLLDNSSSSETSADYWSLGDNNLATDTKVFKLILNTPQALSKISIHGYWKGVRSVTGYVCWAKVEGTWIQMATGGEVIGDGTLAGAEWIVPMTNLPNNTADIQLSNKGQLMPFPYPDDALVMDSASDVQGRVLVRVLEGVFSATPADFLIPMGLPNNATLLCPPSMGVNYSTGNGRMLLGDSINHETLAGFAFDVYANGNDVSVKYPPTATSIANRPWRVMITYILT
ncbi:MAG: hypothetical protein HRU18_02860 [Pseudoalteromonas sp.]|uniref:hypothetical protein n=1 Tax=Pseudoalteromonas sp. TaxID=53249 RepID=UPI001DE4FAD7|nr:hypothetical protein [Pseudoalteromonas sp.]NRA77125.1 hypothetical protein [Pseudoalteromonas sp.]